MSYKLHNEVQVSVLSRFHQLDVCVNIGIEVDVDVNVGVDDKIDVDIKVGVDVGVKVGVDVGVKVGIAVMPISGGCHGKIAVEK